MNQHDPICKITIPATYQTLGLLKLNNLKTNRFKKKLYFLLAYFES